MLPITRWKQHQPVLPDHIHASYTSPLPGVGDICTQEVLFAFADEQVHNAVERIVTRDLRQLPVFDRLHPETVIGLLTKEKIELTKQLTVVKEALQSLAVKADATVSVPTRQRQSV